MLRFTFDNDALGHLIHDSHYIELLDKIHHASERGDMAVYFSRTTFLELVKGTTEKNLRDHQLILRRAFVLSGQKNLLLSPSHHLKFGLLRVSQQEVNKWRGSFYNDIFQMVKVSDYNEFSGQFAHLMSAVTDEYDRAFNAAKRARETVLCKLDSDEKKISVRWFLSSAGWSLFAQLLYPDVLRDLDLHDCTKAMDDDEVIRRIPSLAQWLDAFRKLMYKRLVHYKKVRRGDYFDIQKVLYLDICDYIVSDDKAFIRTLHMPGPTDLHGRVIRLEKFLKHLDRPFLLKRLTSPIYDGANVVGTSLGNL